MSTIPRRKFVPGRSFYFGGFMFLLIGMGVACALCPNILHAQDAERKDSLFGCSEGAVEVSLSKTPPLRFISLECPPGDLSGVSNKRRFVFHGAHPFDNVYIYFSATLDEAEVGRGSSAKLGIYAETTGSGDQAWSGRNRWWKVEPTGKGKDPDASSVSLKFDAERMRTCFAHEEECKFADVELATPDPDVALLAVKFGENLGGANANNWTEASLLLDFRQSPPRILATADCGYNEGGGVCTEIDSSQAERSDLHCEWKADKQDFVCSQESSTPGGGHKDSYLLSDEPAPLRSNEVASLQDAIRVMRTKGTGTAVSVRGIGPVVWIDEVELQSQEKLVLLASDEAFYSIRESGSGMATPVAVKAHPVIDDKQRETDPASNTNNGGWTADRARTFRSRQLRKLSRLTVVQVVAREEPSSQQLYWIGVDAAGHADAVELVGGGSYAGCGQWMEPANVVSVGTITSPFVAKVRLQPPTRSGMEDSSLAWETEDESGNSNECVHAGVIAWRDGKFHGTIKNPGCPSPEKPKYIHVDDDGRLTLSNKE